MNKSGKVIIFILLISLVLISCGGQPPASPTPDMNALLTQSIGTLSASFFLTQTAIVPTATNTPLPTPSPLATSTPLALPSPLASATQGIVYVPPAVTVTGTVYTPTTNPSSLAYGCNNLGFIRDVTIESKAEMSPGERFTKTWQVANTGTCDWLSGYRLVPVSGTEFAEDPVRINNAPVPPNEWRQISVGMDAPEDAGTYTQYWQMSDGAGHTFGSLLGVTIVVKDTYP
jgi:Ig-like domain-containing protein